jgi:subtilase family serine protease
VKHIVGSHRGTPDFSFDANPTTGVWVYDTNPNPSLGTGWYVVGGTSVAAPSLSGIVNTANHFYPSSQAENTVLYSDPAKDINDIIYGNCGLYMGNFTQYGYDLCTGVGSDRAYKGK